MTDTSDANPVPARPPFVFIEPATYTDFIIAKRERFDEDNLHHILVDEDYAKKDRKKLSNYNRSRTAAGTKNVVYQLAKHCQEFGVGRLYPADGLSLQAMRHDMRNPVAAKYYWDVDVVNAHWIIALRKLEEYGLPLENTRMYVDDRARCLAQVSDVRSHAKTEFLKTLYLGNIRHYHDMFVVDPDTVITPWGQEFIKNLSTEVEALAWRLWKKHPHLRKLKGECSDKNTNPQARLMSILFQTEERRILMCLDQFLNYHGRNLSVYIHDGGYVAKLDGETRFPQELLEQGAAAIETALGYKLVLEQKDIKFDWTPKVSTGKSNASYQKMKQEFEADTCIVGSTFHHWVDEDDRIMCKKPDALVRWAYLIVEPDPADAKARPEAFIEKWLRDSKRRMYKKLDFLPQGCDPTTLNLFTGFQAEQYVPDTPMEDEQMHELVKPIIDHMNLLTKGFAGHLLKWFASIVQRPWEKTECAILLRDENTLLWEGGGTGKNLLLDFFGNGILGRKYYITIGKNEDLYDNFNSIFENKLLIYVEEAAGKVNFNNENTLKSLISSHTLNVNRKGHPQYTISDFSNYLFATNTANPLPVKQGNRRIWTFDADPEKRGDVKYFTDLGKHFADTTVRWAFYQYLLHHVTIFNSSVEFADNVPQTDCYKELRRINAPPYAKWLVHLAHNRTYRHSTVGDLHKEYDLWLQDTRGEKYEQSKITVNQFGNLLSGEKDSVATFDGVCAGAKTYLHGRKFLRWNVDAVISGLKRLLLLDEDFDYFYEHTPNNGEVYDPRSDEFPFIRKRPTPPPPPPIQSNPPNKKARTA